MQTCPACQKMYKNDDDYLKGTSGWRVCDQKKMWFNCQCGQLLSLEEGSYNWYDPSKAMSASASSIFQVLNSKSHLPYLPNTVLELQFALTNEALSSDQLAAIAKKDPVLSAELLSLANAAKQVSGQSINSISHSISMLGRKQVSQYCMLAAVKSVKFQTHHFDPEQFWADSILTGQIAEIVAGELGSREDTDAAFLAGSLCNLGKVVTAVCLPKEADKVHSFINAPKTQTNWLNAEKKLEIPDHLVLGEIAAKFWGLPEFILSTATSHHTSKSTNKSLKLEQVVAVANQICHWVKLDAGMVDQKLLQEILKGQGITGEQAVDSFVTTIQKRLP